VSPESLPEDLLSAYLDGECTADERDAVAARLETDPHWRAIYAEIREARDAVRSLPPRVPPAGFVERLLDAPEPETATRRRARRPRIVAGVAAAAAVVVGFALASPSGGDGDVAPPIASLADSHGATVSLQSDPVSGLAPIAATSGIEP
jgi:anti-sigma factor RsiW